MPPDYAALAKKMKLGTAKRPALIGGPAGLRDGLAAALGAPGPAIGDALDREHDWILLFAATKPELDAQLPAAEGALASPGILWIGYLKGSSKRQTDLTRDAGWESIRDTNLMWLALISIDHEWSAFSLRKYKPGEARQTFR